MNNIIKANYTSVNEKLAKTANTLNSFNCYVKDSATNSQINYVDKIVDYSNCLLAKFPNTDNDTIESVQYYCDKFSKKIAFAIDRQNSIDCQCPSIMICGAGNFPVRKKEKQNQARDNFWKEYGGLFALDKNNYYYKKIGNSICNTSIYSDDKNAVQKIKNKIATLQTMPDPYGNKKAEIRRLKQRLLILSPDEVKAGKQITINGIEATFDNIVSIFNEFAPKASKNGEEITYYITIPLTFSDGSRKYTEMVQLATDEKGETSRAYGNSDNNYQYIWKPLTDLHKFYYIIWKIRGSGNKAVIYSILKDLEPKKETETVAETYQKIDGLEVVTNKEAMRIQLIFDGKPSEEIRTILKSNAFKWSPSFSAWQRQLTSNGAWATKQALKQIKELTK